MNVFMSEELPKSIKTLHAEIRNTLNKAIYIIEEEGHKLKAVIDGEIDKSHLTKIRMTILNQKNQLKELEDFMRKFKIVREQNLYFDRL